MSDPIEAPAVDRVVSGQVWDDFCEALKGTGSVQTLVLSDIGVGPVGLTIFASVMSDIPALAEVILSKNKCFDVASVKAFADATPQIQIKTRVIRLRVMLLQL